MIVESIPRKSPAPVFGAVREVGDWRGYLKLRGAWEGLTGTDIDGTLLGHDWMAQCWKCSPELRRGERPVILAVGEGAMLALRFHPGTRRLCFLEERRSQRLDLAAGSGGAAAAWARLGEYFRGRREWTRLDLQYLRAGSAQAIEETWPGLGLAVRERGRVRQRLIHLDRPWAQIEAGFSPYLRSNFRRRLKRLQAVGRVEVTTHAAPEGLRAELQACFALEKKGWKGTEGTAILDDPELHRFYRQLAFRLAARGRFRLYCLRVEGRIIGFEYCVCGEGSERQLSSLKIGYDEEFRTASPGTVLRWLLLQQAREEFSAYDFLGGDAAWKAEWTPETTELRHLRVYNRTWRGQGWRLRAWAWEKLERLRRRRPQRHRPNIA